MISGNQTRKRTKEAASSKNVPSKKSATTEATAKSELIKKRLWDEQQSFIMTKVFTSSAEQQCNELESALGFTDQQKGLNHLHAMFGEPYVSQEERLLAEAALTAKSQLANIMVQHYMDKLKGIKDQLPSPLSSRGRFFGSIKLWFKKTFSTLTEHDKRTQQLIDHHETIIKAHSFVEKMQTTLTQESSRAQYPRSYASIKSQRDLLSKLLAPYPQPSKSVAVNKPSLEANPKEPRPLFKKEKTGELKQRLLQSVTDLKNEINQLQSEVLADADQWSRSINNMSQDHIVFNSKAEREAFHAAHVHSLREKATELQGLLEKPSLFENTNASIFSTLNFQELEKEIQKTLSFSTLHPLEKEITKRRENLLTIKNRIAKCHQDFDQTGKFISVKRETQSSKIRP